jgi:hypothetical protein
MAVIDFATLVRTKWGEEFDQPDDAYQFTGRAFKDTGARGGIYVITTATLGEDRAMNAGNIASAQEGYALGIPDAEIRKGKAIAAAMGAFALTGIANALREGAGINAEERALAITGIAANLTIQLRRVRADTQSYGITGVGVTLTKTLESKGTLVADPASYTITGINIFLTK